MKPRIVQIITRMIVGGAQYVVLDLCERLAATGRYEVTLLSGPARGPEGSLEARAASGGYRFRIVPSLRREISPRDVVALHRLVGHLRELRPDLVQVHSAKAGVLGRWAARIAGAARAIYTVHGLSFPPSPRGWRNRLYRFAERLAARSTDFFVCVSHGMRRRILEAGLATEGNSDTIFPGVDPRPFDEAVDRAHVRRSLALPEDSPVLIQVARLAPLKGHELLLEAFARVGREHPKARLVLVGDGPLRSELERRSHELGIRDRVVFTGLVPRDQVPRLLRAADVAVHASLAEGFGLVCAEAGLARLPVVAVASEGVQDIVRDEETGFLVAAEAGALAAAMGRLLREPALGRRMGERGREECRERFHPQTMLFRYETLYERLLFRAR